MCEVQTEASLPCVSLTAFVGPFAARSDTVFVVRLAELWASDVCPGRSIPRFHLLGSVAGSQGHAEFLAASGSSCT